jgi:transcriptional/translational regulatory protein YebC/TACO1
MRRGSGGPGVSPVGPQDEILSEFLDVLAKLEGFPPETLLRLKELLAAAVSISEDQIRDAIARGISHAKQGEAS